MNSAGEPVVYARTSPMTPIIRAVWLFFGVLIALIGIRILFLALGANEGNGIVDAIYGITEPLVAPFRGIFAQPAGTPVVEIASLLSIIFFVLVAALIVAIVRAVTGKRTGTTA